MITLANQNKANGETADSPLTVSPTSKYLLGGAGLLQAALGGLGLSNGGVTTLAINAPLWVGAGGLCVVLAVLIGALSIAGVPRAKRPRRRVGILGLASLFAGLLLAGYAALLVPGQTASPNIDVKVSPPTSPSKDLGLAAEVRATAITSDTLYFVEVDGLAYVPSSKRYEPVGSPLYLGQFGADSSGKVDAKVDMAVPAGNYSAISVQGWYGRHSGPCQSLVATDSASPGTSQNPIVQDQTGREGCVLVRVPSA